MIESGMHIHHMADETGETILTDATAGLVSAYVSNHTVLREELPALIREVFNTLKELEPTGARSGALHQRPPAVPIAESITPDHIFCLEDGKPLKMLQRHLRAAHGLSPAQYRERWGLASDYPIVAPNYAQRRSELAKDIGLGKKRGKSKRLPTAA